MGSEPLSDLPKTTGFIEIEFEPRCSNSRLFHCPTHMGIPGPLRSLRTSTCHLTPSVAGPDPRLLPTLSGAKSRPPSSRQGLAAPSSWEVLELPPLAPLAPTLFLPLHHREGKATCPGPKGRGPGPQNPAWPTPQLAWSQALGDTLGTWSMSVPWVLSSLF